MKTCICTNCERKFEDDDELEIFEEYVPCKPKEYGLDVLIAKQMLT